MKIVSVPSKVENITSKMEKQPYDLRHFFVFKDEQVVLNFRRTDYQASRYHSSDCNFCGGDSPSFLQILVTVSIGNKKIDIELSDLDNELRMENPLSLKDNARRIYIPDENRKSFTEYRDFLVDNNEEDIQEFVLNMLNIALETDKCETIL